MDKKELRNKYKLIRDMVLDKEIKSDIICKRVMRTDKYLSSDVIALYKSFNSEVDTDSLIYNALFEGKVVLLPRIDNGEMKFYKYNLFDKLVKNRYGIYEPINDEEITDIDLMIVPGLCFDSDCNRLGYGGGYYDKYLSNKDIYTIGVCYKEQIVDELKSEDDDVKVKKLVCN